MAAVHRLQALPSCGWTALLHCVIAGDPPGQNVLPRRISRDSPGDLPGNSQCRRTQRAACEMVRNGEFYLAFIRHSSGIHLHVTRAACEMIRNGPFHLACIPSSCKASLKLPSSPRSRGVLTTASEQQGNIKCTSREHQVNIRGKCGNCCAAGAAPG
eukprot:gene12688-biopygen9510